MWGAPSRAGEMRGVVRSVASHLIAVRRAEKHAEKDHGVVPRALALDLGLDKSALHHLVRSGRWTRLQRRAYVVTGAPVTWRTRLAAVLASLETGFAFSHRTAGALMGLDGVSGEHVEIVTCGTPKLHDVVVHRVRSRWTNAIRIDGLPVTSAHRTILDLFAVLPAHSAELALDDALRKQLTSIDRLWNEYVTTCTHGRNGCRAFRNALLERDDRDGTLQSRMEAKLRRIMRSLPGSEAVPQFEVRTDQGRYFLDFAYPDVKLGIEAQSIKWHMGEAKFCYDMKRDRRLKRAGWTMLYFSWDDLLRPDEVRAEITELRATMARLLL